MSISRKINLLLFIFGSIACTVVAAYNYYELKKVIFDEALEKAQLISSFAMASRDYTVETMRPSALKMAEKGEFYPEIMAGLYVARSIGGIFSENMSEYSFKQASIDPIFADNRADENERSVIEYFSNNRDVSQKKGIMQRYGSQKFYVARPIIVQEGCMKCHYSRETAPIGVAAKYPGPGGYGWKVGQVIATLIVYLPIQSALDNLKTATIQKVTAGVVTILLLLVAIGTFMRVFVINPIHHLTELTDEMGKGRELGVSVNDEEAERDSDSGHGEMSVEKTESVLSTRGDEIKRLTESFSMMKSELKKNIRNLMDITAAKERIEGELNVARDIQLGLLPKVFPPFPQYQKQFNLFATLHPAKEVGGDLYDYFFINDDTLCFTLGDVSDKGVPAALFMTITMTLIKNSAKVYDSPAKVMAHVNDALSTDNPRSMFVTLIVGYFNIRTGEIRYANAGHNLPILVKAGGQARYQEGLSGPVAGAMEGLEYKKLQIQLEPGDAIFFYTDGVTEAMNRDNKAFSDALLESEINRFGKEPVDQVIPEMMEQIKAHAGSAPQSDDIAMLMFRYQGD